MHPVAPANTRTERKEPDVVDDGFAADPVRRRIARAAHHVRGGPVLRMTSRPKRAFPRLAKAGPRGWTPQNRAQCRQRDRADSIRKQRQ